MKNIFGVFKTKLKLAATLLVAAFGLFIISCEDDDKNFLNDFELGGFVRFVTPFPNVVGVNDPSEVNFSATLETPDGNVASYSVQVRATVGGTSIGPVPYGSEITSFPSDISFTASSIASTLGLEVSDLGFGDNFAFIGTAVNTDGDVYVGEDRQAFDEDTQSITGGNNSDDLLDEDGYRNAFEYNFTIACPAISNTSSFAGVYTVVSHTYAAFGFVADTEVTVTSGPASNQITLVGGIYSDLGSGDLVLDIDLNTGVSSIANTSSGVAAWNAFGLNAVYSPAGGTGLSLECIDPPQIGFNLETDCCISNNVIMQKIN